MEKEQIIDSHFSLGQNVTLFMLNNEMVQLSRRAHDYPSIENIQVYYNSVYEIFLEFMSLLSDQVIENFNTQNTEYFALYVNIMEGKETPTMSKFLTLLLKVDYMRQILFVFLQKNYKYFYRLSERQVKGLKTLDNFMENNIFGGRNG